MVKEFLSQRGIDFEERDVSRSQAYARELVQSTGQMGVPVTVFDGQVVVGFDQAGLEKLVGRMQTSQRPSFGAAIADASKITARQGTGITPGAYIGRTRPGSSAEQIGLLPGDIITGLNGKNIASAADFEQALSSLGKGSRLSVVLLRGGRKTSVEGVL